MATVPHTADCKLSELLLTGPHTADHKLSELLVTIMGAGCTGQFSTVGMQHGGHVLVQGDYTGSQTAVENE